MSTRNTALVLSALSCATIITACGSKTSGTQVSAKGPVASQVVAHVEAQKDENLVYQGQNVTIYKDVAVLFFDSSANEALKEDAAALYRSMKGGEETVESVDGAVTTLKNETFEVRYDSDSDQYRVGVIVDRQTGGAGDNYRYAYGAYDTAYSSDALALQKSDSTDIYKGEYQTVENAELYELFKSLNLEEKVYNGSSLTVGKVQTVREADLGTVDGVDLTKGGVTTVFSFSAKKGADVKCIAKQKEKYSVASCHVNFSFKGAKEF